MTTKDSTKDSTDLRIPGLSAGAWSTGELSPNNNEVMLSITTALVLARNIEITSAKFSQEITDYMKQTDWTVHSGLFVSIASYLLLAYYH